MWWGFAALCDITRSWFLKCQWDFPYHISFIYHLKSVSKWNVSLLLWSDLRLLNLLVSLLLSWWFFSSGRKQTRLHCCSDCERFPSISDGTCLLGNHRLVWVSPWHFFCQNKHDWSCYQRNHLGSQSLLKDEWITSIKILSSLHADISTLLSLPFTLTGNSLIKI